MTFSLDIKTADAAAIELLSSERAKAHASLIDQLDAAGVALTGSVPINEQLSWPKKELAARAYLAGQAEADEMEMLNTESALTGDSLEDLAHRIVSRADAYSKAAAMIAGLRRSVQAALDAAETPAALEAIMADFADDLAGLA